MKKLLKLSPFEFKCIIPFVISLHCCQMTFQNHSAVAKRLIDFPLRLLSRDLQMRYNEQTCSRSVCQSQAKFFQVLVYTNNRNSLTVINFNHQGLWSFSN